jgi:hypothetical protein
VPDNEEELKTALRAAVSAGGVNSTLSDWGRAIVIVNPADDASILAGVKEWLIAKNPRLKDTSPNTAFAASLKRSGRVRKDGTARYPQHPPIILNRIRDALFPLVPLDDEAQTIAMTAARAALRGWLMYVLVTQAFSEDDFNNAFGTPAKADKFERSILLCQSNAKLSRKFDDLDEHLSALEEFDDSPDDDAVVPEAAVPEAAVPEAVVPEAPVPEAPVVKAPAGGRRAYPAKDYRGLPTRKVRMRQRTFTRRAKMSFKQSKAYRPFKTRRSR